MENYEAYEKKDENIDYEKVTEKLKEILNWRDTLTEDESYEPDNYHLIYIGDELLTIRLYHELELYGFVDIEKKKDCNETIKKHIDELIELGYDMTNITKEG